MTGPTEQSSGGITDASVGAHGATAAQVQQALHESASNASGAGIKVGVLSDSFNNLGGYAADQADGALPAVQVLADLSSGGTDEGRAMLQVVHDIAPNAGLAFYTADEGEQAFANGILALAAAGCKVICDDVSYLDEPFFGGGVIAQAIQTVEAEGVTYITSAGNNASNAYEAAWTPTSGSFDGRSLSDTQNFGGSVVQTVSIAAGSNEAVPLLFEWNQAYGTATPGGVHVLVFHNGTIYGDYANYDTSGEVNNPWIYVPLPTGTYQIAIENEAGPNPGLIKEIAEGNGWPVTISDANAGTVFGHGLTPGAITVGAVSTANTPAFGFSSPVSESFSSSGAGSELLYASNGTALPSPEVINPVAVSSVDNIATTISGGLGDFYGTSAASASLAGVAALILAANPDLTPAQVEQVMAETATPMSNSAVSGAGLVNVDAAVAAATALLPPDLTEYVAVSDTTMAADGSVTIDAYNMNIGHAVAGPSTAKIYLSTNSTITTSDMVLATLNSGSLTGVGQTGYYDHQTFTVALPGGLAPGTYYIGGIADYNNQVSEGNENNNTYNVVQVTLTASVPPDLTEYVAVNHTTVAAGGSITIDAYDMNIGEGVSGASTAQIYLSTNSTITTSDTVLATLTSPGTLMTVSQPGYYDHQTVTVALPGNLAPGTYYIGGIADYNNQVSESNETNNTYNVVKVTVPGPDLTEYVAVNHTIVAAGGSITIDAYDMNIGNAVSGASTAQIYLSTNSTITTSDTVLATLTSPETLATVSQPGYYDHQQVTVALPGNLAPGTYYIGGIADYNNHVSESNETNNTYNVVQITVPAPPQPDLTEYVAVNHTTVAAGGSLTIDAYDMNIGNAVSGASTAQIYLSTNSTITTSDTVLATLTSPETLATVSQPGYYDHQQVTVALPGNLAPGTYYIGGIADYNNQVSESNETNNTYNVVQITVPAQVSQATTPAQSAVTTQSAATSANASLGQLFAGSGSGNFVFAANPGNAPAAGYPPAQDHVEFNHAFAAGAPNPAAWHPPAPSDAGGSLSASGLGADMLHHWHDFHIM